jgi:hypothetical protein
MYWPLNTTSTTSTTFYITQPTITTPIYYPTNIPVYRDVHTPTIISTFVPYTPAIIRRCYSEHEREEQRLAAEAQRVAHEAEQELIRGANSRARELLLAHLTGEQRKTFEENGWFVVEGGRTKQKYRVNGKSIAGNIDVLGTDHILCAHAPHSMIPHFDHLLAQKVMLELAEDDFLLVANRTHRR